MVERRTRHETEDMMIDHRHIHSRDNSSDGNDPRRQSPSLNYSSDDNQAYLLLDNSPGHPVHQEMSRSPQDSIGRTPHESFPSNFGPSPQSPQDSIGRHPQESFPSNSGPSPRSPQDSIGRTSQESFSGPSPNEPAQSGPPVPGPTVSSTTVGADYIAPPQFHPPIIHPPINLPTHNPADTTSVSDSSTRLSAIQTVQTYLTQQAQEIRSHLTAVLSSLVQGEVCTQCTQLAQEIGAQISSIREEVIRPTGDQDEPMLSSSEENEGSRRRGKQSLRHNKQPNDRDEADKEDEGGDNESDEEEISPGSRKYQKQLQVLRVSIHYYLLQQILIEVTVGATPSFPPTERCGGEGGKRSSCFTLASLCPCYPCQAIHPKALPHRTRRLQYTV